MSKSIREATYTCCCDCRQTGCPGHTMRLIYNRSTDIVVIEIDGEEVLFLDDNAFATLLKLEKELK
jgi:hypothetical protein